MGTRTIQDLRMRQALPLEIKIRMTESRIRDWVNVYGTDGVYVSFSGGKDSTVLLHIVRNIYPNVKAMFVDIPTQYPELKQFVQTFDNVDITKPKINFFQVCEKYGFPMISKEVSEAVYDARRYLSQVENKLTIATDRQITCSCHMADILGIPRRGKDKANEDFQNLKKGIIPSYINDPSYKYGAPARVLMLSGKMPHKEKGKLTNEYSKRYDKSRYAFFLAAPFEVSGICCKIMKKEPAHNYQKETGRHPIIAQMADESELRTSSWIRNGCNAFNSKEPKSNPMSFWTEQDVLRYIKENNIPICSVYGNVVSDSEEMGQMSFDGVEMPEEKLHCTGCQRTGCVCCAFGAHCKDDTRFIDLKKTHPQMYKILDVAQNNGYTMRQAIEWMAEHGKIYIKL